MPDCSTDCTTIRDFHRLYYERGAHANYGRGLHADTTYHGHEAHKCPLDLWIFQEILHDVRPGLVIEIGTYLGGTTLFLAHQLELLGHGRVLSIDNRDLPRPAHPRIGYLLGNSQDAHILASVREAAAAIAPSPVLVIHDGDHRYAAALADLESYAPLVTCGSYLIVEDTNVNGHPVLAGWGPGPWEAVATFLQRHPEFEPDPAREKFLMTYNPGGYLRRNS
jgi:cephalosporin hydroxylase